jgi:hypothetical protein
MMAQLLLLLYYIFDLQHLLPGTVQPVLHLAEKLNTDKGILGDKWTMQIENNDYTHFQNKTT